MDNIVLYIGGFELPDKNAAAHRVLSNAKILKDIGKKVVLVGINKDLNQVNNVERTFEIVQGFETYAVPYPKKTSDWIDYLTSINDYIMIINKLGNVETVICYNFPSIALNKINKFCQHNNIKCIADVTEWYSVAGRSLVFKVIKGFDTWYRMRIIHKKLDGLIVISKFLKSYYHNNNVVYIPTLIDLNEKKWISNYRKSDQELRLVYAGNPGRKDRIDILIGALKDVSRVYRLDVIGISQEQYIVKYPQHKIFLESCKYITFHGRLGHLETLEFVKKANYSCFFRENDRVSKAGFPTKFAEAISCGTPVITNASSNIKDYMDKGKNGICIEAFDSTKVAGLLNKANTSMPVQKKIFMYNQ